MKGLSGFDCFKLFKSTNGIVSIAWNKGRIMKTVNAATLKEWLAKGEAVLVDVREPAEHAAQNIPGARLVPLSTFTKYKLGDIAGKKVVVHCQAGKRGQMACDKLLAEDPSLEVYNLEGGISAWTESGCGMGGSGKCFIPLDRQVLLLVGTLVLMGSLLGYFVSPYFFLLSGFFGLGLMVAGLTGFCGGALLLAKMPWNQKKEVSVNTACSWKPKV